jgi:6-phosphogluconolactonase (cycloisomerase 2 family)
MPLKGRLKGVVESQLFNSAFSKMKFFDLFRRSSRRTITGASLPLAAGFLLWAAPLRAEFVYLLDVTGEAITTYSIGSNGALSQVGSPLQPTSPYYPVFETMDPKGRFVFCLDLSTNGTSNDLQVYSIGSNGALTQVPGSPVSLTTVGNSLTVDPTGKFLYISTAGGPILAYSIGVNGTLTAVKGSPFTLQGVRSYQSTIDPSGKFLYAAGFGGSSGAIAAYSIDSNGALTIVPGSPFLASTGVQGAFSVTIDPTSSDLFTLDISNSRILAYNIGSNGALTPVAGSPFATPFVGSVALDPTGQFLYVGSNKDQNNAVSVYSNTAGTLTPISGSPFPLPVPSANIWSVTLDPTGRFAYVQDYYGSALFTYSIGSGGGLTLVTSNAIQASSFISMPLLPPFVFVQNENEFTPNTTTVLSTDSNGALLPVPLSPFITSLVDMGPAVDPTGKFIYEISYTNNTVSVYGIGLTGSLTALSTVATGNEPYVVASDPTGRYIYVVNSLDWTVSAYTVGSTGTLTPVTGSPFATGGVPVAVAVDRSGKFVYVVNNFDNTVSAYKIGSTGALSPVPGSPFATGSGSSSVAVDPVGNFAYVSNENSNTVSAYSIGSNGALTPVPGSPFATGQFPFSVTVDPMGLFVYVANEVGNNVSAYSILANGALTPVTGSPFAAGLQPYSVAIDPTGSYAYVNNFGNDNLSAYAIGSNGALTPISGSPAGNFPVALNVSPIPFAASTSSFETEAGTPPTFTLDDTFTLGRNSTGINPVTQQVTLRIDTFAVTIPANKFNLLADGTFKFRGIINKVTYTVTIAPLGSNSFKLSAKASGQDLTTLGKTVSIALIVGGNAGTSTAAHKQ